MSKINKIQVQDLSISISEEEKSDYICLTDMAKGKQGNNRAIDVIKNWLRTRSTIEFLGTWELLYNPNFKVVEFDHFRMQAGLHSFVLTPKQWIERTGAIGLISKAGRYGGTYAHKDIAFEFGSSISPVFKLLLIKEYQRLKQSEGEQKGLEWDVKRVLTKVNYKIHTDAVKEYIIPKSKLPESKKGIEYAKEADILNLALFGCTAKEWRTANPTLAKKGKNLRDVASVEMLTVLANLESLSSVLIEQGMSKQDRFLTLRDTADKQLRNLRKIDIVKSIESQSKITPAEAKPLSDLEKRLNQSDEKMTFAKAVKKIAKAGKSKT